MSWGNDSAYRKRHRAVTANLEHDEYAKLKEIADAESIAPSTLATRLIRWSLSERLAKLVETVNRQ